MTENVRPDVSYTGYLKTNPKKTFLLFILCSIIQRFGLGNNTEGMRRPKILNTVMCFLMVVSIILFAREKAYETSSRNAQLLRHVA